MNIRMIKGYVLVVFSGLALLAVALLVILQWGQSAGFSLFGRPYEIIVINSKVQGGVNTALLMIGSGIGGVLTILLCKVFFSGAMTLRKGRVQQTQKEAVQKLSEFEKAAEKNESAGS